MKNQSQKKEHDNYSINIQGSANGVQIQQGTINSIQIQNINQEFDYEKVMKVLNEIGEYTGLFDDVYGKDSKIAQDALSNAREAICNKKSPEIIKKALLVFKDITLKVSSSLITTGILELLREINI